MQLKQFFKKKTETQHSKVPDNTESRGQNNSRGETIEKVIKELEIFQRLNKKQLKLLSSLLIPRRCSKGEIIINKGSVGLGMFIIISGQMEVYDEQDGKNVRLAIVKASECVGEMSLVDEQPRSANVKALDDCEYLLLTRDSFNGLVKRDPEILWGIVPIIVKRLQNSSRMVIDLSQTTSLNQSEVIQGVTDSEIENNVGHEVETREPHEVIEKLEDSHDVAKETVTENVPAEKEDDLFSSILQLSASSLMYLSTIHLLSTQEALRLTIGSGPMSKRISKSENVISSVTTSMKENMSERNQKLYDTFWEFMASLASATKQ